ncbi:MAG: hypothetical protein ACM3ZV_02545 [Bacillota bacterium]
MRLFVRAAAFAAALVFLAPAPAAADELTTKVYGATLEPGTTELELRYGRLVGEEADGEDGLLLEVAHHFSSRFYGSVLLETERDPGGDRRLSGIGLEGIVALGKVAGVDTALYGEYGINRHGADDVETKLLLEKRAGEFDARLNLIAERELERGAPIEFGYAASADTEVAGELRLGAMAVGELGTTRRLTTHGEHFAGPNAKFEIEHLPGNGELAFEAGYLFAIGEAREETNGLARFMVEYEFHF